jgi:ABC-type Na+ efflux pump permease subunit
MNAAVRRVRTVALKEFREFRRNRFILGTTVILPIIFIIVPIINLLSVGSSAPASAVRKLAQSDELVMLLVPVILPTAIAAYSVVGERDQGTLEPVLTTPITEKEMVIGKAVAAVVPTVIIAYLIALVFHVVVRIQDNPAVVSTVFDPAQIVGQILFVPLLATWSTWVAIAVSIRANDVRVAQQLSSLGSLSMLGVTSLFSFGVVTPSVPLAVAFACALFVIDSAGWRVVSAMFDRESLIVRYRN